MNRNARRGSGMKRMPVSVAPPPPDSSFPLNPGLFTFVLLDLPVITELYSLLCDDDVFHVEH